MSIIDKIILLAKDQKMELHHKNSLSQESSSHVDSTWAHRAWFAAGCATVLVSIAKALILTAQASTSSRPWLEFILAILSGYVAADLGTGIYHWAIDNYGSSETPFFGSQIEGFQGHHDRPWAITKVQMANNLHAAAAPVAVAEFPINVLSGDPVLLAFVGALAGGAIFSQQFHAWSHTPKGKLPAAVVALQEAGIILRREDHAAHHRPPFNSNYCIVSGVWNRVLDKIRFFVALEVVVLKLFGHTPRSWSDPNYT